MILTRIFPLCNSSLTIRKMFYVVSLFMFININVFVR